MNILVLGGTRFVGRHIVEALVTAGHRVSVLTRGQAEVALPATVEFLTGDRNEGAAGLSALAGHSWDTCVDVSGYTPRQVRASTEFLKGRVRQYVFVSTVSVYAEPHRHPVREDDPLLPAADFEEAPVTFETYGPMKVTCERLVQEVFGTACAILRPQLVAGPYDYTPRYPYWPDRVARGGKILAAGRDEHIQVIDARDIGSFVVKVVEDSIPGIFNLAGPRLTWGDFLTLLGATDVRWTTEAELVGHGLEASELPIYLPEQGEQGGMMDVDNARALAAGLTLTAPEVTARDTRAWSQNTSLKYALTPEREAEWLATLNA